MRNLVFNNIKKLKLAWLICHFFVLIGFFTASSKSPWTIGLLYGLLLHCVGQGICLHRLIAHRSFIPRRGVERFLSLFSCFCILGSPASWAALHRFHHIKSDSPEDPHSPLHQSWVSIWLGSYLSSKQAYSMNVSRDLLTDPFQRFLHKYYFLIVAGTGALIALFNFQFFIFFFCLPAVVTYHLTMLGSCAVHIFGYTNFPLHDHSKNNFLVSVLTLGDGWHNNHHANPRLSNHGIKWWEFDLQSKLIDFALKVYPSDLRE